MLLVFVSLWFFFCNTTAFTVIYTLSLHDALPIFRRSSSLRRCLSQCSKACSMVFIPRGCSGIGRPISRSEEHTSELQSLRHLVCRLLLEKKKEHRLHVNSVNYKYCKTRYYST